MVGHELEGGCLCGSIRYHLAAMPEKVGHCHCGACRKSTGAAFATFAWSPEANVSWSGAEPVRYRSSEFATRWFCPNCGATLAFKYDVDDGVDIAVGSLDEPSRVQPKEHTWYEGHLPWLSMDDDGLVKYARSSPESTIRL